MQNNLRIFSLFLVYCLPIALQTGPAIPDIITVIISICFLFNSIYFRDYSWLKFNYTKVFLVFWLILIIISFFSYNKYNSFIDSLIFIRFFLFSTAISYWIITDIKKTKLLLLIVFLSTCLLIVDTFYQFLNYNSEDGFGPSIFGFESFVYGRMSGPFNDEIIGAHISKFFFVSIFFLLYFFNLNYYKKFFFIIFFILACISVFLSGERMALATLFLGLVLFLIFVKQNRLLIILSIIFTVVLSLIIINFHKSFHDYKIVENKPYHLGQKIEKQFNCEKNNNKICNKVIAIQPDFFEVILNFEKSVYFAIFSSAFKMWLDNPITGIGLNNFDIVCLENEKYHIRAINYGNCSTHPHNFYLQWLTESGILGFSFFVFFVSLLFYNSYKSMNLFPSKIAFINLSVIFWPLMSTGSLLKNHHGIMTFFIISICLILTKIRDDRRYN